MKFMIHAVPARMWYVEDFLIPELKKQGADDIRVWNDTRRSKNLMACMEAFSSCEGDGGTWHIQDDVILCRDFVQRCEQLDDGIVYGFCCPKFTDNPDLVGRVHVQSCWHSFQCVRIPDEYARGCAEWVLKDGWKESRSPELSVLYRLGQGDDSFFREYLQCRHPYDFAYNAKPNLVDHVDYIVGGSMISPHRGYLASAFYWDDEDLIAELEQDIKRYRALMNNDRRA